MAKLEKGNLNKTPKSTKHKTTKLRDLGSRKNKAEKMTRVQATTTKGNRRFYSQLRLKEKAANERMRQLELAGIKSPAYQSIQAQLEILGKRTKGERGRRFSETGKATYAESEVLNKMLDEFLYGQETSTLTGAKKYMENVWNSANKNNQLAEAGITREEWLKFWENMPDKKDRLFGSEQYVAMIRAYTIKNGSLEDLDKMSIEEITAEIKAAKSLKNAYTRIGLTPKEVINAMPEDNDDD